MANYLGYTVRTKVVFGGRAIDAASFSNCLFVSHHNVFTERVKAYASADELLDDGFASGSPAHKFATGVFAGKQSPTLLYIGRAATNALTIQVNEDAVEDDVLSVNMNVEGTKASFEYTVLSGDEGDSQALGDGLAALIQADAAVTTAVSDANGLITITMATPSDETSFGAALNTTIYATTAETPEDILAAIRAEIDSFSIVTAESHIKTDQSLYAAYAEGNDMIYLYSTADVDAYDPAKTDDVFSVLKGTQEQYTMGMFNEKSDIQFPEGAVAGSFLAQDPSFNFTMNLQDLVGITPSNLTSGQKSALVAKNGNFYELEFGVGAFKEGFTSNGDFIDRSRFGLWLKLRSQESMFATMKSFADRSSALNYSDTGILIVKSNLMTDVINVAVRNGSILEGSSVDSAGKTVDLNPVIETLTRASQTNNAIGQRLWEGFEVEVVYTGSIHHIDSKGYIINNRTAV
jgi:hypothetical protein